MAEEMQADVMLYGHPLQTPNVEIDMQESISGTGAFHFTGLVGDVMRFQVKPGGAFLKALRI